MIWIILILAIAVLIFLSLSLIGYIIGTYNGLQGGRINIDTQFSNIKTEYQRRADLLYNLAEAAKQYARFEKSTLTDVIEARSGNFGKTPQDAIKRMKGVDAFLSKLMVVVERYPKLGSIEQFNNLSEEVRVTEDRVNIARTAFNGVVREYNLIVATFPSNYIARMFGFSEKFFFENEEESNKAPKLDLRV